MNQKISVNLNFIIFVFFFFVILSDQIDSSSVASSTNEANKQRTTIIPVTPIKPNILFYQPTSKDRPSTITKYSTTINEKTNANLLESLDELNRLSNQMDHVIDNEQNR